MLKKLHLVVAKGLSFFVPNYNPSFFSTSFFLIAFFLSGFVGFSQRTHIPDANFRRVLLDKYGITASSDNTILNSDAVAVDTLNVLNKGISSLVGIEAFTALAFLSCDSNSLTSLNVSANTSLTYLRCTGNQLISLNVSANTNLTTLYCSQNKLISLDVSANTALTILYSHDNQLNSLDVSANTVLTYLLCFGNQLTDLNVSKSIALTYLDCDRNQLTSLDVSANTALAYLDCHQNNLMDLNVSKNTALTYLDCDRNQLTSLDVSVNIALTRLYCNNNQLVNLNLRNQNNGILKIVVIGDNQDLTCIQVDDVSYSTTNWPNKDATASYSENCSTLSLTTNPISLLTSTSATLNGDMTSNGGKTIIERGFVYSLSNTDLTTTGTDVTKAVVMGTGVFSKDITSLTSNTIYYYKAYATNSVETAYGAMVSFTTTATIPTGAGTTTTTAIPDRNFEQALIDLDIDSGEIDGFVLTANISGLTRLSVFAKGTITSLKGIEAFTSLTYLSCGYNQLTSLDVSKNTALTILACSSNQLTSLDVSKNTALTILACSSNQLTSLDVSKNTALTYFLDCRDNQLTSLDISKNTDLTILTCAGNQLSELNVSKNTALTLLYCGNNQLTSLDVSENTALTELYCSGNQLSELNLSANMTLTHLQCSNNQLTALNVSVNMALTNLRADDNQLTTLDVSVNTALRELSCSDNQLTSLNVANGKNIHFRGFYSLYDRSRDIADSFKATGNPDIRCIQVDNVGYSTENWLHKDATADYSTDCTPPTLTDMVAIPSTSTTSGIITIGTSKPVALVNADNEDFTVTSTLNGITTNHPVTRIESGSIILTIIPAIPKGATISMSYDPTQGSSTEAITSVEGSNPMSPVIEMTGVLSNEGFETTNISILPNPTDGILNITVVEKAEYMLLNIRGQTLKTGTLDIGESKIDILPFAKGIYFLNLKTGKGSFTEKIVRK